MGPLLWVYSIWGRWSLFQVVQQGFNSSVPEVNLSLSYRYMTPQYQNWVQQREGWGEWPHFGEGFPSGPLEPPVGMILNVSQGYAGTPQTWAQEAWEAAQRRDQHIHRPENKIGVEECLGWGGSSTGENPSRVKSQERLHTGTMKSSAFPFFALPWDWISSRGRKCSRGGSGHC